MIDECGYCRFDKAEGLDYCSTCSRPLSIDALDIEYNMKKTFEERFKELNK